MSGGVGVSIYMISNKVVRNARLTREVREAALKIKQYCNIKYGCEDCYFSMTDGGCLIRHSVPGNWHLEADAPSDMERRFAKRMLNEGFDYVNLNFDIDGRHVTVYDSNRPDRGKILTEYSFDCLIDPGNYLLQSIVDGKVQRRTAKP